MADLTADGPAVRFARARTEWEPHDWWRMEARALQAWPAVVRALAFFAPKEVWKDLAESTQRSSQRGGCLFTVINIAAICLPAFVGVLALAWLFDTSLPFPLVAAGWIALVAVLLACYDWIWMLVRPSLVSGRTYTVMGLVHVVPSGFAIVVVLFAGVIAESPLAVIAIVADVIVGVIYMTVLRGPTRVESTEGQRRVERLGHALAKIPNDQRAQVQDDLHAAFDALAARGLVDESQLLRAWDVPLGELGQTFAPASRTA